MKTNETMKSKEGVAIIVVLGMLALLMIMATTFSITMRVERIGAGGFAHNVSAENLVWAGLARAIDQIEANMGPADPDYPANAYYPTTWTVLVSGATNELRLDWGQAAEFIPTALSNSLDDVGWENVQATDNTQARVAYLVMNCSGLLDANYVGGSNRLAGTSVKEIQVEDFDSVASATDLETMRMAHSNYYTLQEFDILQNEPGGGLVDVPDYFVTYSRYPSGSFNGTTIDEDVVDLSGDVTALRDREVQIVAKLHSPALLMDGQFIFDSLTDYIDTDSIPGVCLAAGDSPDPSALASALTEAVPMINEVIMTPGPLELERINDTQIVVSNGYVLVEVCYPFVKTVPAMSFDVEVTMTTTFTNLTSPDASSPHTDVLPIQTVSRSDFILVDYKTLNFAGPLRPPFPVNTNDLYGLTLNVSATVSIAGGGGMVDATPYPITAESIQCFSHNFPAQSPAPPWTPFLSVGNSMVLTPPLGSWEAVDPRRNWDCSTGTGFFVYTNTPSFNTTNGCTLYAMDQAGGLFPEDLKMHISDQGELVSVGELGFMLRHGSIPLAPIRLFDYGPSFPADSILDSFVLGPDPVRRGLCNLNVCTPDDPPIARTILRSALKDLPLGYPGSMTNIPADEVGDIIDAIQTETVAGNSFTNLSNIGTLDWRALLPGKTDLELTSIIAHMSGLFGTRQNLFTIIVEAKPFSLGMGQLAQDTGASGWSPSKRGVFTVWRDPFPNTDAGGVNTNLPHKTFVQSFRWLTDD